MDFEIYEPKMRGFGYRVQGSKALNCQYQGINHKTTGEAAAF